MGFLNIKEGQNIWVALTASLLVHALVLLGSALGFIQIPKFSVQQQIPRTIEVTLDEDKYVPQTTVSDQLDYAALQAVRHWKFLPGRIGDMPVESTGTVPIRFKLVK